MHHTLENYESNYNEIDSLSKKIKRSNINSHQLKLSDNIHNGSILLNTEQSSYTFMKDVDTRAQNQIGKLSILPELLAQVYHINFWYIFYCLIYFLQK
jgi:hypothetical protein